MKSKLTIAGLMIGSIVGFLLRPSVPLMGQLPLMAVITRGANLRGLDQLLVGYARTSFKLPGRGNDPGNHCRIDRGFCSFQPEILTRQAK